METWNDIIEQEKQKPYFNTLKTFVDKEYETKTCYPEKVNVFNALKLTSPDKVKVVLLGQDPYHQPNQAHGLAFSVLCKKLPPSLQNIYKEIESDLGIKMPTDNGNLTCWAEQGVLLLNTSLTVRQSEPNSHSKMGWKSFTDSIIKYLGQQDRPIVFILWGKNAQDKEKLISNKNHLILKSAHPSPLSAYNGFFGCKHFSKTNEFLKQHGLTEIDWSVK